MQKELFGRLNLINVSFRVRKKAVIPVVQNQKRYYKNRSYPNDIGLEPLRGGLKFNPAGSRTNWNFNIGIGRGRNRGNINLNSWW